MSINLLDVFGNAGRRRLEAVMSDLLAGLGGPAVFVGGLAIRYSLATHGIVINRAPSDVDVMVLNAGSLDPGIIVDRFLIHHYHAPGPGVDLRWLLVHKETNTPVDVFHWKPDNPDTISVPCGDIWARIRSASDQFAVCVFDLETMRMEGQVDPKQLADAQALQPYVDRGIAEATWSQLFSGSPSGTIWRALGDAEERERTSPGSFAAKPWQRQDTGYRCARCVPSTPDWPLASMDEIYCRLGYVQFDGENIS